VFSLSLPPLPPAEQINGLIALVQSLVLQSGTANSLIAKLQGAASALDRENIEAACGNLGAFLNESECASWQEDHRRPVGPDVRRLDAHSRRARLPLNQTSKRG